MTVTDAVPEVNEAPSPADQLCERLFGSAIGFTELFGAYLGDRLGLYHSLKRLGSANSEELAAEAGVAARYAREWLEHQATAGLLAVRKGSPDPAQRRYRLPDGCVDALTDPDDLANIMPLARALFAIGRQVEAIADAFVSGGGVPYAQYGSELAEAQAGMNRPILTHLLGDWMAEVPDVHARLQAEPPARVADIACGAAWSSIALARAYPGIHIDACDIDEASAQLGRRNVEAAGLSERISVHTLDASQLEGQGRYDVVTIFEAVHDMAQPVEVLRNVRSLLVEGGAVVVMDENVGASFDEPGPLDSFFYGASVALCLPAAMAETEAAGTGAVMRRDTLERYATEAGFASVEVLPAEHPFFRLYRLHP
jgi:2-polyprenyl-3-methyl-5-hydroxy-6-metoxy-1,4-benzoquinol methylase